MIFGYVFNEFKILFLLFNIYSVKYFDGIYFMLVVNDKDL